MPPPSEADRSWAEGGPIEDRANVSRGEVSLPPGGGPRDPIPNPDPQDPGEHI
jgi:hypothetical protein